MVEVRVYDVTRVGAVHVERMMMDAAVAYRARANAAGFVTLIMKIGAVDSVKS